MSNSAVRSLSVMLIAFVVAFSVIVEGPSPTYGVASTGPEAAYLNVMIEVLDFGQESAKFHIVFTLTSSSDFNYEYNKSLSGIKPRILLGYEVSYGSKKSYSIDYVGVYSWTKVDLRRRDMYQARAEVTYNIACHGSGYLYPFDEYTHHFYVAANGVDYIPDPSTTASQKSVTDLVPAASSNAASGRAEVLGELSRLMSGENQTGWYVYRNIYDIEIALRRPFTYSLTMLILAAILIIIGIVLPLGSLLQDSQRVLGFWKNMIVFYPIFWLNYRQSFAPKWITCLDLIIIVGMAVWVLVAVGTVASRSSSRKNLGDLYEWFMNQGKKLRFLHVLFAIILILELAIGLGFFLNLTTTETRMPVISGIGAVILSTALVYSNLIQTPALRFLAVMIEPWDATLVDEYKTTVYVTRFEPKLGPIEDSVAQANPKNVKRFPRIVREIRCAASPSQLKVSDDITNIGYRETNIHEYSVEEFPGSHQVYVKRDIIGPQQRVTLSHIFPKRGKLSQGFYQVKITARAATQELSESCWISVSPDGKTIRWCSRKEPLEKLASECSESETQGP